jgi:hypothetical protein
MKKHTKIYFDQFDYGIDDIILCEVCGAIANDIHHIEPKGMGGSKTKDYIENLIALCRKHHEQAHANILTKEYLKTIVNNR